MPTPSQPKRHLKSKTVLHPAGQRDLSPHSQSLVEFTVQVPPTSATQEQAGQSTSKPAPLWSQANKSLEEVARPRLTSAQPASVSVEIEPSIAPPEAVVSEATPLVVLAPEAELLEVTMSKAVTAETIASKTVALTVVSETVAPEIVAPIAVSPIAVSPEAVVFKATAPEAEVLEVVTPNVVAVALRVESPVVVTPKSEVLVKMQKPVEDKPLAAVAPVVAVAPVAAVAVPTEVRQVQGVLPSQILREAQGHSGLHNQRNRAGVRAPRWKWHLWVGAGLGAASLVVGGAATGAYSHFAASQTIAPNVFIGGVAVGGLTPAQARERVRSRFGSPRVSLRCGSQIVQVPLARLGAKPAIEGAVKQAVAIGRGGFLPSNLMRVYGTNAGGHLVLPIRWNPAQTRIALQEVNAQVAQAPVDARLRAGDDGLEVVPDRAGRALDLDGAAREIRRHYRGAAASLSVPMRIVKARVSAQSLDGRDVQLAQYTTHFNAGIAGRTENIRIACRAIQNHVLMPGETFSFNSCTGERTARKGYQMAHIFLRQPGAEEPEVAEGLAGGVCQVSSTLFNAVRKTNAQAEINPIKIVERNTHSLPVTYVPPGLDATVAWPGKDFRFRNVTDHPVYVHTQMGRSKLSISIWNRVPRD